MARAVTRLEMGSTDAWLLVTAAACVLLAGAFSAADAALASFSRARAQELVAEGRAGARQLVKLLDDAPRYLNTALLMRLLCEIAAIVIVTQLVSDAYDGAFWPSLVTSILIMALVSFVVIGVAPRTLGRQHAQRIALAAAGPISSVTTILGPIRGCSSCSATRSPRGAASERDRSPPRPSFASWSTWPRRLP